MNELAVSHGDQRVILQPGQVAYVGRRDSSAVVVTDERVSREHIRLSWGAQGWLLENVGRSGTYVRGEQVSQIYLARPVEARLALPDGPLVRFEPVTAAQPAAFGPAQPAAPGPGHPAAPGPASRPHPGRASPSPPLSRWRRWPSPGSHPPLRLRPACREDGVRPRPRMRAAGRWSALCASCCRSRPGCGTRRCASGSDCWWPPTR